MKAFINSLTKTQMKILAVLYIILLVAVGTGAIYVINSVEILNPRTEKNIQTDNPGGSASVIGKDDENGTKAENMVINNYVYVGDSRFVAMSKYMGITDTCIARIGVGCQFFEDNLELLRTYDSENTVYIVNLGVNSVFYFRPEKFAATVNEFAAGIKGRVCYATVAPVDDAKCISSGYGERSSAVDKWNRELVPLLSSHVAVIDLNAYMMQTGFGSTDGLHYTEDTYKKIYEYLKKTVDENL